jgi:hypothetical protein
MKRAQVPFEEMRWTGTLLALRSPRTQFPDNSQIDDSQVIWLTLTFYRKQYILT